MSKVLRWLLVLLCFSVGVAQSGLQILRAQSASDNVIGGEPIRIIVQLTAAGSGGQLPIATDHPELCQVVPILVGTGQSQVRFAVPTRAVQTPTPVIISLGFYGNVRDIQVTLQPEAPNVTQLRMAPRMISGDGGSVTVTLDRVSPRAAKLNLVANENISIATPLPIPPGVRQFEATFTTKVLRQGGKGSLSYQGVRPLSAETQLLPPVEVSGLEFTPAQVEGGQSGKGVVSLKAPAGAVAKVKLSGPANLRLPADVSVPEGAASAAFTFGSATARAPLTCTVSAATPLGQTVAQLTVTPTTSLAASEAAQYYLMASAREGWLSVADGSGRKWRFKPSSAPKLGKLEAFGYLATVQGQGLQEGDSTPHSLVVQLRLVGAKEDWKVAEALVLQVDSR